MDFPEIDMTAIAPPAPPRPTPVATAAAEFKMALAKVDLQQLALSRFGEWRTQVAELVATYKDVVYDCKTTAGMAQAIAARAAVRAPRYAAQNVSKASKSELAKVSKAIGAEEQAIIEALATTEEGIDRQIRVEEERKANEKAERERLDLARRMRHEANIDLIVQYKSAAIGLTSEQIGRGIAKLDLMRARLAAQDALDAWEEYADRAKEAIEATTQELVTMRAAALEREQAAAEAERQRLENEAEKTRLAEERRVLAAERAAVEAERVAQAAAAFEAAQREAARVAAEQSARIVADDLARVDVEASKALKQIAEIVINPPVILPTPHPNAVIRLMTVSEITERLGIKVTQGMLATLGIVPEQIAPPRVLYREDAFPLICDALIKHIQTVKEGLK